MVLFNYSTKEITAKIVYYGPGLCGKTTNLQFIYDSLPQTINKGKMLSLATKTDRTLFFDFLPIDLGTIRGMRTRLQLYTVPGQVFYNTTRKLVLKGADGVVFVADSQKRMIEANLESLGNLEENLAEHDMKLSDIPMILQFNKRDLPDVASMEELNAALNKFNAPIYEAVAPTGIGVHETLKAITRLVLNSLKERYADKREQKTDAQARAAAAAMAASSGKAAGALSRAATPPAGPESGPAAPEFKPAMPEFKQAAPESRPAPMTPSTLATFPGIDTTASEPEQASWPVAPACPVASPNPPASFSQDGDEPLAFELPELEEISATGAGGATATPDDMSLLMADEPELEPVTAMDDPSPTEMMNALPADLMTDDDLLELAPDTEMPIDVGSDELLELAEEPLADLAHLEDSVAMPALDVTTEMTIEDEPVVDPLPLGADATPGGPTAVSLDDSSQLESMLRLDSVVETGPGSENAFDDSLLEPIEVGPVVTEDHHDTSLPLTDQGGISGAMPIPLAFEPDLPMHPAPADAFGSSIAPSIPVSGLASPAMHAAASVTGAPEMAREINLPVKLEIGGRSISFELKISLDLTEISAHAVTAAAGDREARS